MERARTLREEREEPALARGERGEETLSAEAARRTERARERPAREPRGGLLVGEVLEAQDPHRRGRARVRWESADGRSEAWLPTLHQLSVREGDRVLLARPENWSELVVTGVLDGFARRPEPERTEAGALELRRDECLKVRGADGRELLELHEGPEGPVVRLLQRDVDVEMAGVLRLSAEEILLRGRKGRVRIEASDDVVVRGEAIRLN